MNPTPFPFEAFDDMTTFEFLLHCLVSTQKYSFEISGTFEDDQVQNKVRLWPDVETRMQIVSTCLCMGLLLSIWFLDAGVPLSALECDFDSNNFCGYTNSLSDDFDWTLNNGATPSQETGPDTDHTTGNCKFRDPM